MTYDKQQLIAELKPLAEPAFAAFSSKLLPGTSNIMGIRIPKLRKIAQKISLNFPMEFLNAEIGDCFEERILFGMVLGYANLTIEQRFYYITKFLPYIDNWSVCDTTCCSLKFARDNQTEVFQFIVPLLESNQPFSTRFSLVMMLNYFTNPAFVDKVIGYADSLKSEAYYVKMAQAWALCECFTKYPAKLSDWTMHSALDVFTYNKTISKLCDSYKTDLQTKEYLRTLRQK